MSYGTGTVRTVLKWAARCGEGPVWDAATGTVLWVDILAGQINRTDPLTTTTESITLPTMVGAAAPRIGGGYVAAITEGFAAVEPDGSYTVRAPVLEPGERMNDGKCDPAGRFWAGSTDLDFRRGAGALWVLDRSWRARKVIDGLSLPNGMGWSPDGATFYLIDSVERVLLAFDVDQASGTLSERRELTRFPADSGALPDGMCVDAAGTLWVVIWNDGRMINLDRTGTLLRSIPLPIVRATSCAFVGPNLDQLWVTSACDGLTDDVDRSDGLDGSIFAVDVGAVSGQPDGRYDDR
jgi:sugar lactone lactonase YvrE